MEKEEKGIEITPEMIEAGYQVLKASGITDDLLEADRETVAEIYLAMRSLERRSDRDVCR